jgi:hypothetical protein
MKLRFMAACAKAFIAGIDGERGLDLVNLMMAIRSLTQYD